MPKPPGGSDCTCEAEIAALQSQIDSLQAGLQTLANRVSVLEAIHAPPSGSA